MIGIEADNKIKWVDMEISGVYNFNKHQQSLEDLKTKAEKIDYDKDPQTEDWDLWVKEYESIGNDNEALRYLEKTIKLLDNGNNNNKFEASFYKQQIFDF